MYIVVVFNKIWKGIRNVLEDFTLDSIIIHRIVHSIVFIKATFSRKSANEVATIAVNNAVQTVSFQPSNDFKSKMADMVKKRPKRTDETEAHPRSDRISARKQAPEPHQ